jgi:hypothetical protein
MLEQLNFATAAMHAYAHQWTCQVAFNPRMIAGMGLTDGEGVERLWSLLVDLIGILRKVSVRFFYPARTISNQPGIIQRSRRIIIIERQIQWIANLLRAELGRWEVRRRDAVDEKRAAATRDLAACGYDIETLRLLWEQQRKSQLSVRRGALWLFTAIRAYQVSVATKPLLKQDMKVISDLQDTVDTLDERINSAEVNLTRGRRNVKIKQSLLELRNQRDQFLERIQVLYSSLSIVEEYPHIKELGNDFVQLLVEAHNTKALLRARIVGRIFEINYLDRAVGGRDIPLGDFFCFTYVFV